METNEAKVCEACGTRFERQDNDPRLNSAWSQKRFCSRACVNKGRRARSHHATGPKLGRGQPAAEFILDVQLLLATDILHMEERMGRPFDEILARLRRLHRPDLAEQVMTERERCFGPCNWMSRFPR